MAVDNQIRYCFAWHVQVSSYFSQHLAVVILFKSKISLINKRTMQTINTTRTPACLVRANAVKKINSKGFQAYNGMKAVGAVANTRVSQMMSARSVSTRAGRSTAVVECRKVAILGAAGGIGQPLSLLMKMNRLVTDLALYDIANVAGVAADLSHCNTPVKVSLYPSATISYLNIQHSTTTLNRQLDNNLKLYFLIKKTPTGNCLHWR